MFWHATAVCGTNCSYKPSLVAPLWRMLQLSATQVGLLKKETQTGKIQNSYTRRELQLLCLLIIHYIITPFFVLYNIMWDVRSIFLFWEADKEQTQKSNLLGLVDKHTHTQRINPAEQDRHSCLCIKLRMAHWRDSHTVFTEASTEVEIKWT